MKRLSAAYFISVPVFIIAFSSLGIILCMILHIPLLAAAAVIYSAVCFLAGRYLTAARLMKAPEKPWAVYLPALVPFAAGLVVNSFSKIQSDGLHKIYKGAAAELFAYLNFFQTFLVEKGLAAFILINAAGIICFAVGERRAVKVNGIDRPLPGIKLAVSAVMVIAALAAGGEYAKYYHSLSTVDIDMTDYDQYIMMADDPAPTSEGYGFPYEHGLSSVPLRPYYVENPENKLALLTEPSELVITDPEKMPVLDGAEAAYPVYSAIANACYENIGEIQSAAKENGNEPPMPIRFTNTVKAYESLISGETDIFFGAMPSEAQKKLGGDNVPILAFQRPKNSGSQTMMEHFMGDVALKEPLKVEFEMSMVGVITAVAEYQNKRSSIGYSFRYYASGMAADGEDSGIKFLSLDGVYPDPDTIRSGEYPMTTSLYAIYLEDNDNENVPRLAEFMQGRQGQELIEKTGYIPLE